jgi:hypothetical protein
MPMVMADACCCCCSALCHACSCGGVVLLLQKEKSVSSTYTEIATSMMHLVYKCVFFVARKPEAQAAAPAALSKNAKKKQRHRK